MLLRERVGCQCRIIDADEHAPESREAQLTITDFHDPRQRQGVAGQRRRLLDLDLAATGWQVPQEYDDGPMLHEATRAQGLEGIVSKRVDAPYRPGQRSDRWLKFAHRHRGSFVIGGWRTQVGTADRLAALLEDTDDPACPDGGLAVSRYRTDGFALVSEVGCDGEEWRLVLGRIDEEWQELDDIQQDPLFGCDVMGMYDVPAFIAGDTCLDGEQTQEYTG